MSTVVATSAGNAARDRAAGLPVPSDHPYWFLVVRDGEGRVVGGGMRTAPFEPYPLFLLPMPDEDAVALARLLVGRGELVGGVNGALPAARLCAEAIGRLESREMVVEMHTRLFQLVALVDARPTRGRLRAASADDIDLVETWFGAFMGDAHEQAGRPRRATGDEVSRPDVEQRVDLGRVWLWEDEGESLSLVAANAPEFGVTRIGPVYTPARHRGHGYASAAVAEVSRRILAVGARPCLFTDQANPTWNKIYEAIGFRPVVDMVNLSLRDPA